MKIYVIGLPASGKTILFKKLAKKYKTKSYELDCIVYKEILKRFNKVLQNKSWIIEDVGRDIFEEGLKKCNYIYYLKISRFVVYGRVIKRWLRQKIGKEDYNYPPNLFQFFDTFKTVKKYLKKQSQTISRIEKYHEKVIYLSNRELKKF